MLMDDDDDMLWRYIDEQNIYEGLTILQRRESVPTIVGDRTPSQLIQWKMFKL
jgi:hypothetical protein